MVSSDIKSLDMVDTKAESLALKWLKDAAEDGHKEAQAAVGLLLYYGNGDVNQHKGEAREWFRKLADTGSVIGQWLLGRSLFDEVIESNDQTSATEAIDLLIKAANADFSQAYHYLGVAIEYGTIDDDILQSPLFSQFPIRPADLYKKSFGLGFIESGYNLAILYTYGRGVQQDFIRALDIFRNCALSSKHAPSMRYLALFYTFGDGLSVDYQKAIY